MNAIKIVKLWRTSIVQLPHPGCSRESNGSRTVHGYFQSLQNISIINSKMEKLPSFHHASQLVSMVIKHHRISTVSESEIQDLKALYEWNLYHGDLLHFPNLTSLGYNNRLAVLQLGKNKISSIPCLPDNFKMYNLSEIVLHHNHIRYICNMNFAPNIKSLNLTDNLLIGKLFVESINVPFHNLHTISTRFNNIDVISDSDLHAIRSCQVLQMGENKIKRFPNIKLVASTAVDIELLNNCISDVPCTALDNMDRLLTFHLDDNIINHICPLLLTLAPKLTHLGLSGNRLMEIPDLRIPARMQPTKVLLHSNPFRCLATLCWMLFIPDDSHLKLEIGDATCTDQDNVMENIFTALTAECTCKTSSLFSSRFHLRLNS